MCTVLDVVIVFLVRNPNPTTKHVKIKNIAGVMLDMKLAPAALGPLSIGSVDIYLL